MWNALKHFAKQTSTILMWHSGTVAFSHFPCSDSAKPQPTPPAMPAPAAQEVLGWASFPAGLKEPVKTYRASAVGPQKFLKAEFV